MNELIQTLKEYFQNEILFSDEFSGDRHTLQKRFFDNDGSDYVYNLVYPQLKLKKR